MGTVLKRQPKATELSKVKSTESIQRPSNRGGEWTVDSVLTAKELAGLFKIQPSTIYRLVKKNKMPGFRMGRDWRFSLAAIEKWTKTKSPVDNDPGRS
jgi:excisionase family DNA binding protein